DSQACERVSDHAAGSARTDNQNVVVGHGLDSIEGIPELANPACATTLSRRDRDELVGIMRGLLDIGLRFAQEVLERVGWILVGPRAPKGFEHGGGLRVVECGECLAIAAGSLRVEPVETGAIEFLAR